jgi:hypothetical protein
MWVDGRNGDGDQRRECVPEHDDQCEVHAIAAAGDEFDIVPTVEANGNEPISPLSIAAEPHCVSKELQLGRRS